MELLLSKAETQDAVLRIMAPTRGTIGDVYRVHSGRGGEFIGKYFCKFLREQQAWRTTTQGRDPNSNGLAAADVGIVQQIARERLLDARFSTYWRGMAALGAANALRARAGQPRTLVSPPGDLAIVKVQMDQSDDPASPFIDPALQGPGLTPPAPKETARR